VKKEEKNKVHESHSSAFSLFVSLHYFLYTAVVSLSFSFFLKTYSLHVPDVFHPSQINTQMKHKHPRPRHRNTEILSLGWVGGAAGGVLGKSLKKMEVGLFAASR
jgi:hypothetical protein